MDRLKEEIVELKKAIKVCTERWPPKTKTNTRRRGVADVRRHEGNIARYVCRTHSESSVAAAVVNQGGEIVLLNVQAEKQFGYRRDELLGQKVTNIIPVGFAERLIADDLRSTEGSAFATPTFRPFARGCRWRGGHGLSEAARGLTLNAPRPDLILLDLNLPKMDGREVLAHIKEDENLKTIPTVILTTSEAEADIVKSYQLQANCYLSKPVQLDAFEAW